MQTEKTKYHFCTYFDVNYILKGLVLFKSLNLHLNSDEFNLYVICLDKKTYQILQKLSFPNLIPISLDDVENHYSILKEIKKTRKLIEYYFTLTPSVPSYIFDKYPNLPMLTYIDADLFFYSNPQPIFDELANNSVIITPHRFPKSLKYMEDFGKFNVQFITYKNDTIGRSCLSEYKKKCIEWCYDYRDKNRYADQKYLDDWKTDFDKVTILRNKGAGVAPWNWMQYRIDINKNQTALIDGEPLIFYHFHGLKFVDHNIAYHALSAYKAKMPKNILEFFYINYCQTIKYNLQWLKKETGETINLLSSDKRYNKKLFYLFLLGLINNDLFFIK